MDDKPTSKPKMTAEQKLAISILLFLTVLSVGFLIMLATGKMVLPV